MTHNEHIIKFRDGNFVCDLCKKDLTAAVEALGFNDVEAGHINAHQGELFREMAKLIKLLGARDHLFADTNDAKAVFTLVSRLADSVNNFEDALL